MTEMANWEFYNEYEEIDAEEQEPSFSLYDFKKWLESQHPGDMPSFRESVENKKREIADQDKDALKEQFKQRVTSRVQRNIDKRLAERKKKRG
jgi:hypothetical protein